MNVLHIYNEHGCDIFKSKKKYFDDLIENTNQIARVQLCMHR